MRLMVYSALFFAAGMMLAAWAQAAEPVAPRKTRFDGREIRASHPRIWLDEDRVTRLKNRCEGLAADEVRNLAGNSPVGLALSYVITGYEKCARDAVAKALAVPGRMAPVTMARVYDWCYPVLTAEERGALAGKMTIAMKKEMNAVRSWRSFHNSLYTASMIVGFPAIALYGQEPLAADAVRFLNQEWEDVMRTFDNVFPDGEWGEGFDYNRHATYDALRYLTALETATGGDFLSASPHMRSAGCYIMYGAKPNGLIIAHKDNDWPFVGEWEREAMLILASRFRNGHCQHFLNHARVAGLEREEGNKWKDLLWYDPTVTEDDPAILPLSRIFRGDGLVVARSGWRWERSKAVSHDTWVAFRCGKYYGDHAHYDNNTFDVYYRGELAIDSGRYDDDWGMEQDPTEILKSQFFNYYQRTIAHNTILVYDPEEKFEMGVLNDGGQMELLRVNGVRNVPEDYDQGTFPSEGGNKGACDWKTNSGRWDTGRIIAYKGTDDFTYVCGDAARSYSPAKVESFTRQFLFVQPNVVIVYDRVVSGKPEFTKTWLLHTVNEPKADEKASVWEAVYGDGRLVCVPVLPEKRSIRLVGGPDDECMVAGVQFHYGPNASSGRKADLHRGELPGAWRLEMSPAKPAARERFLVVMFVTGAQSRDTPLVRSATDEKGDTSLTVVTPGGTVAEVRFAGEGEPGGVLKLTKGADVKMAETPWVWQGGKVVFEAALPQEVVLEEGRPQP